MATFSKNDQVRIKAVLPEGPVLALRMDEEGVISYLVAWTDADNAVQQRWFLEDQLELVTP